MVKNNKGTKFHAFKKFHRKMSNLHVLFALKSTCFPGFYTVHHLSSPVQRATCLPVLAHMVVVKNQTLCKLHTVITVI